MTTLWDKLNLKEDQEIVVINAPASFAAALKALPRGCVQQRIALTCRGTGFTASAARKDPGYPV